MDSLPGDDPTLPVHFNGSVNISRLPDVSGDEIRVRLEGGTAVPDMAEDAVSPTRVRTMKDFENQIIELRKENFNLKLRIYFLEERMQQKFDGPNEEIYRINIELKVELESLKRERQEREQLLIKASKAVETLAQGGDVEIQRLKEEAQTNRIKLLEEDLNAAHGEAEKALMRIEQEKVLRLAAEEQLSLITNKQLKDMDLAAMALEEKERCIEQLNLALKSKETLIQQLEEAKSCSGPCEESLLEETIQEDPTVALLLEKERELEAFRTEARNEKSDLEERIQSLQEAVLEREKELSIEKKNALKRDKAIQGLTSALKSKENENEELNSEIEGLNVSLANAREAVHKAQMQKFQGAEDCQTLLMEKETLLAELRSENLTKDTENRKLQRKVKRIDQELKDLHLEREKLVKDLEEAQLQKSRSDKTINDLRNQLEKLHHETAEKEKALEHYHAVVLSESSQKLQSQERLVARLMDSASQKDQLLQKLDGVVKDKDVELQELLAKYESLLKEKEDRQRQRGGLSNETCASQGQQPVLAMIQDLKETKESQYAELVEALRKERDIFSSLVKSLKDADGINSLQAELNHILLLRKQLEENLLVNWNLRKVLEDQIKVNKKEGSLNLQVSKDPLIGEKQQMEALLVGFLEYLCGYRILDYLEQETISSWGDQTSYLSICLGELDPLNFQVDHLSLEELRKKVAELLLVVKELHSVNQDLKRQQLEFSKSDSVSRVRTLDQSEFLERQEGIGTQTEALVTAMDALHCGYPEKVIPSDDLDRPCYNRDKPEFEHAPAIGDCFSESQICKHEASRMSLLTCLADANEEAVLDSRQEQMKIANKLLDHLPTSEQDSSSDELENKHENYLKEVIIQLRAKLKLCKQGNEFSKQPAELRSTRAEKKLLDPSSGPQMKADIELLKAEVKDTVTHVEGNVTKLKDEGTIAASEVKAQQSKGIEKREHQQVRPYTKSGQQENLRLTSKTHKSDSSYPSKKSRLPILWKCSRSTGNICVSSHVTKPDVHLQHRPFVPDEDLKRRCAQSCLLTGESKLRKAENRRPEPEGILGGEGNGCDPNLPAVKVLSQEFCFLDEQDVDSGLTYSGSKSLLSLKLSVMSIDDDSETITDAEELRQKIRDMKSELATYRALMLRLQPAKPLLRSDAFGIAQSSQELPAEGPLDPSRPDPKTQFSGTLQQVDYQVHAESLTSHVSEKQNEETVDRLQELLLENEAELEKEQIANMHLLDEVYRLQTKLQDVSPLRYGSRSHVPAHERSYQQQKMKDSHSVCVTYRQHLSNLIKAFEDLLQASEVDYYIAEGFREQLNQSVQLFERLEKQCLYGESLDDEVMNLGGLAQSSLSDFEASEKSSYSDSPKHKQEGAEVEREEVSRFPPELLMEHLQEIRMLRHQLEESIKTNDRLRKQLEQQVVDFAQDQGSANVGIRSSEQHNSLTSEIHFLRKQNQVLNVMLAKGSRDKQKENEKLRESLSKKHVVIDHLRQDYECVQKENEKLQKQINKREEENGHLTHEVYNIRNELNRLQLELNGKQHQLLESDKLLQSLQLELKVYEKLDEAIRSKKDLHRDGSDECWKDQNHPLDLHELLSEIRNLRSQLERSIKANKTLHEKLEEQLVRGKQAKASSGSAMSINYLVKQESQLNEFKFPTADSNVLELQQRYGCCTSPLKTDTERAVDDMETFSQGSSSGSKPSSPSVVPGHHVWADKNGRHVLGLVEDYNSLWKQVAEGRKLLSQLEFPLNEMQCQEPWVLHQASLGRFSAAVCATQRHLEDAACLLKRLWRVSLPMKFVHSVAYSLQDEGLKAELHKLRRKLSEQEKKLHSTVKRLHSTKQLKENMEKVIIDQLALTHDVLKKARGNLEVPPAESNKPASSVSKKRVL